MPIIPWKPFSDLERFFEDEDWFLPVMPRWGAMKPAMDVYETDKDVVAEVNIPDFDPEKVDISVKDGVLTVSGKMDEKKEEKEKGYWRKEIRKGSFERMVRLPVAVKEDAVDATYEKGVLKIVMPKTEAQPTSKVKIKVKENK
jgi:HSP20 family protein